MGTKAYPEKLRERTHELYYLDGKPMRAVLKLLQTEFPTMASRLTTDRLRAVATSVRTQKGLKPKNEAMSRAAKRRSTKKSSNKEIIEAARKLRQKNYRWKAIKEELQLQFPDENIPTPKVLSNMVKGNKLKDTTNNFQISISGPSGLVCHINVSSGKSIEKIIKHILEA